MSDEQNNTGNRNSGDWNSGYRNSGDWNSGYRNSGNSNSGDWNSGYRNSGDWNSGYRNSGYWNSGDWNSGYRNSGYWNSTSHETGCFNSVEPTTIRAFNSEVNKELWDNAKKPDFLYFELCEWVSSSGMTDDEKEENKTHITTGGYLKTYEYKEAFKKSFDNRKEGELELLKALPNFDAEVFKDISGIDITGDDKKKKEIESIRKEMEKLSERMKELENE